MRVVTQDEHRCLEWWFVTVASDYHAARLVFQSVSEPTCRIFARAWKWLRLHMCAQIIPFGAAATVTGTVCHDIPNNWAGLRLTHLRGGRRIVNDRNPKAGNRRRTWRPCLAVLAVTPSAGRLGLGPAPARRGGRRRAPGERGEHQWVRTLRKVVAKASGSPVLPYSPPGIRPDRPGRTGVVPSPFGPAAACGGAGRRLACRVSERTAPGTRPGAGGPAAEPSRWGGLLARSLRTQWPPPNQGRPS